MRATFVSSHAKQGGSEQYLLALLRGLSAGVERDAVVLEPGPFVAQLADAGYPPLVIASGGGARDIAAAALGFRRHLRRRRPDVVHANGVKAALVAAIATIGTGTPVVWVKHDFSWDGRLARLIASRCDLVVGVSEAVVGGIPEKRRRVVHPGLRPVVIDRELARARVDDLVPSRPVISLVGRFHPVRGHNEVIAAAPAVLRRVPTATFLFAGGDDASHPGYRAAIEAAIEAAGSGDHFRVSGYRDDAIELIAGSDAVVLPTVRDERGMGQEGFGLVAVEAMAVGTPVVAYASGALPEVLGRCGRLVSTGDRAGLADALIDVLDADVAGGLAACGVARVAELFSEERWLAEMEGCYAAVTATRETARSPGRRPPRPARHRRR